MATFRLGSKSAEVRRIQKNLPALEIYRGPVDGDVGGGTETASPMIWRGSSGSG